jgi:prepilin-type N-terminal cleavage/methylation domain-containing protein
MSVWKSLLKKRRRTVIRKGKGFTLIELLVVISIVVLLMALLLSALQLKITIARKKPALLFGRLSDKLVL